MPDYRLARRKGGKLKRGRLLPARDFPALELPLKESGRLPLVLVPGLGCGVDFLNPLTNLLPDFRIIQVGLPGVDAKLPGRRFSTDELALDLLGLLEKFGIDQCLLLGYSMGGFIAQRLALLRPSMVQRLLLLSTSPGGVSTDADTGRVLQLLLPTWPDWVGKIRSRQHEAYAWVVGKNSNEKNPQGVAAFYASRNKPVVRLETYAAHLYCAFRFTNRALLGNIRCPTLVVHGRDDQLVGIAGGRELASRIPEARFLACDAGHITPYESPQLPSWISDFAEGRDCGERLNPLPPLSSRELIRDREWRASRTSRLGLVAMLAISKGLPVWVKRRLGFLRGRRTAADE